MRIDPRRLAVLLSVHRNGGVLAAADELRVSPSAISQQIARLEAEAGVAVLDRQPSGAVLTAAGRVLADTAERIESELLEAGKALAELSEDVTGTVVVGAFKSVIRGLLVPMAGALHELLPGVELTIVEVEGTDGLQLLRAGEVDLLVVEADSPIGRQHPRGTRDVVILDDHWRVAMPDAAPVPTTLNDLETATWLGVAPRAAAHRATQQVHASLGVAPAVAHRYDDYDVAMAMVAAGLGVALLPSLATRGRLPDGIQVVDVPGLETRRVIARHRVSRSEPRQEVTAVLDELVRAAAALDE